MEPEVEARRNRWSPAVLAKMAELSQLISREKFGDEGPPVEIATAPALSRERVLDFGDTRITLLRGGHRT